VIHRWQFEDGTSVRWTDRGSVLVSGAGPMAESVRVGIDLRAPVGVGPAPDGDVRLDPLSVWLLHKFLEQEARRLGANLVETSYVPAEQDMPSEAASILQRDSGEDSPGAVY